jgi:tetratricopeptide (TPR) repeat protein
MKTSRSVVLLGILLLVACIGFAAALDRWFMSWRGNRARDFSPLRLVIGEGQKMFAGHFYRKADVYFHSGMYPSIFDNNDSFKTAHIGEDAGATGSKNTGDEDNFLGPGRDLIDRFSRNFFPSRHTHLDEGGPTAHSHGGADHSHGAEGQVVELGDGASGEVREILPWLKIAQELDPENPLTYSVTSYWLRQRMGKVREAQLLLREGLRYLPNHPVLLFELGRIFYAVNAAEKPGAQRDPDRARHIWHQGIRSWQEQEAGLPEPDLFILEQLLTHLAKLEEDANNLPQALSLWERAAQVAPDRAGLPQRVAAVRQKLTAPASPP